MNQKQLIEILSDALFSYREWEFDDHEDAMVYGAVHCPLCGAHGFLHDDEASKPVHKADCKRLRAMEAIKLQRPTKEDAVIEWKNPKHELPGDNEPCYVGDRIVIVVMGRANKQAPLTPRLVVLEATEIGWKSPDPTYGGYTVEDGHAWAWEQNVCSTAGVSPPSPK